MGLNTNFHRIFLDRPLTPEHKAILEEFADTEHEDDEEGMGYDAQPPTVYASGCLPKTARDWNGTGWRSFITTAPGWSI